MDFVEQTGINLLHFGMQGNKVCIVSFVTRKTEYLRLMHTRICKEPFVNIPEDTIREALIQVLDQRNHPLMLHCNKGKVWIPWQVKRRSRESDHHACLSPPKQHRTGCLVGCLRKVCGWSLTYIFDEYRRFAGSKVRILDQQFIELFDQMRIKPEHLLHKPSHPSWT